MPRRSAAVLLAALLLAGCAGPGADDGDGGPDGPVAGGGPPAPRFGAPATLPGGGGPEPTIAIAPDDGTIYVAAQDPSGPPRAWTSRDGGATWTMSRPSSQSGGEVAMAAGARGAVYTTQLGVQGNVVSVSHDHGRTWTQSLLAAFAQYFDREWVAVEPGGGVVLVAREFGQAAAAGVSRSDDGGVTWLPQGRAWDASNEPGLGNGNLLAAEGRLWLPYVCRDARAVCVAVSGDGGATWTQHLVVQRSVAVDNVYPVVAVEGGTAWIAWSDASAGRLAVWVATSTDGGATWSRPWRASAEDETATLPWLAAGAGRLWAVWLSTPDAIAEADATPASWKAVAARLEVGPEPRGVLEKGPVLAVPVHEGVLSKPVGRPGEGGPYDRRFGDFYTATVARDGALWVAVAVTGANGSPEVEDVVVRAPP